MPLTASQRNIPIAPTPDPNQGYTGSSISKDGGGGSTSSASTFSAHGGLDTIDSLRIWVSSL